MFGYLMAILGPSLEFEDTTVAVNTTFFASKEFPGLGMRLQRASAEALRQRGVSELVLWAGGRGSGPRLASLYKRLGANDWGQLYHLDLKDA